MFFQVEIIINVLVSSFRFIWIHTLSGSWFYDHYKYFYSYLYDFRRQNLTDPRAVRVFIMFLADQITVIRNKISLNIKICKCLV